MKVFLDMVGCRLNQSEIETYARQFQQSGHDVVEQPGQADLVVVNTCAVTQAAASDSRQKIRQAAQAGAQQIVVTGCWSTLDPQGAAALAGVSAVVPNGIKDDLVLNVLQVPAEIFEREVVEREPLPGARLRTRAFIKVQDGCDNRCTFCVTTLARGQGRSRTQKQVIADIQAALAGGAQEIVLTGVHLGSWGHDFVSPLHLRDLITTVLAETDIPRLRLSSLEPWDLESDFFSLWQNPRLCRHLHLPLQSGSATVLRRMARKTTPESFQALLEAARRAVPSMAITTDVIVGFPGETEHEFAESRAYIEAANFAGGHVFSYSARAGTAAARMPGQVPQKVRKQRSAELHTLFAQSAAAYARSFVGQEVGVLWENNAAFGPAGWRMSGLTDNYLRVTAYAPQHLWNQITPVWLEQYSKDGLFGIIQV